MTVTQMQAEINERSIRFSSMSEGELLTIISGARDALWDAILDYCLAREELKRRGADLDDIPDLIGRYGPRIAAGTVSPRAWAKFAERGLLMQEIAMLPFEQQESLADGERIKMFVYQGPNLPYDPRQHRMVDPLAMTPDEIRYVFGGGKIRDQREQAEWAQTYAARAAAKKSTLNLALKLNQNQYEKIARLASAKGMTVEAFAMHQLMKAR